MAFYGYMIDRSPVFNNICSAHYRERSEVGTLLCINDDEKSGVVLGIFLCISQLMQFSEGQRPVPPVLNHDLIQTEFKFPSPLTGKLCFNPIG